MKSGLWVKSRVRGQGEGLKKCQVLPHGKDLLQCIGIAHETMYLGIAMHWYRSILEDPNLLVTRAIFNKYKTNTSVPTDHAVLLGITDISQ